MLAGSDAKTADRGGPGQTTKLRALVADISPKAITGCSSEREDEKYVANIVINNNEMGEIQERYVYAGLPVPLRTSYMAEK